MFTKLDATTATVATGAATSPIYMADMQHRLSDVSHVASDLLPILGVIIALGQIGWFVYSKMLGGDRRKKQPDQTPNVGGGTSGEVNDTKQR